MGVRLASTEMWIRAYNFFLSTIFSKIRLSWLKPIMRLNSVVIVRRSSCFKLFTYWILVGKNGGLRCVDWMLGEKSIHKNQYEEEIKKKNPMQQPWKKRPRPLGSEPFVSNLYGYVYVPIYLMCCARSWKYYCRSRSLVGARRFRNRNDNWIRHTTAIATCWCIRLLIQRHTLITNKTIVRQRNRVKQTKNAHRGWRLAIAASEESAQVRCRRIAAAAAAAAALRYSADTLWPNL